MKGVSSHILEHIGLNKRSKSKTEKFIPVDDVEP